MACFLDQDQFDLKFRRAHGVAESADMAAVRYVLSQLQNMFAQYTDTDTWRTNEFGLYCKQFSYWMLSNQPVEGLQKEKKCFKIFATFYAAVTEIYSLTTINKLRKPKSLGPNSGKELVLDYCSNKKTLMTKNLFLIGWHVWIYIFYLRMAEKFYFRWLVFQMTASIPCYQVWSLFNFSSFCQT